MFLKIQISKRNMQSLLKFPNIILLLIIFLKKNLELDIILFIFKENLNYKKIRKISVWKTNSTMFHLYIDLYVY